jgi:long-subunit acyl-CoA synthetase (AMP-forming)
VQVDDKGAGSLHPITLITLFKESLLVNSHRPALAVKRKDSTSVCASSVTPQWQYWTLGEYWDLCLTFGKSMLALGLQPFAVVNILGFNSPEWLIGKIGVSDVSEWVSEWVRE